MPATLSKVSIRKRSYTTIPISSCVLPNASNTDRNAGGKRRRSFSSTLTPQEPQLLVRARSVLGSWVRRLTSRSHAPSCAECPKDEKECGEEVEENEEMVERALDALTLPLSPELIDEVGDDNREEKQGDDLPLETPRETEGVETEKTLEQTLDVESVEKKILMQTLEAEGVEELTLDVGGLEEEKTKEERLEKEMPAEDAKLEEVCAPVPLTTAPQCKPDEEARTSPKDETATEVVSGEDQKLDNRWQVVEVAEVAWTTPSVDKEKPPAIVPSHKSRERSRRKLRKRLRDDVVIVNDPPSTNGRSFLCFPPPAPQTPRRRRSHADALPARKGGASDRSKRRVSFSSPLQTVHVFHTQRPVNDCDAAIGGDWRQRIARLQQAAAQRSKEDDLYDLIAFL